MRVVFLIVHQRAPAVSTSASPTFTWEIDARSPQPNTIGNVIVVIIIITIVILIIIISKI